MYSDTMKYQTETKVITILGPTTIIGDNRTLYSEDGWYNSLTSHAELYKIIISLTTNIRDKPIRL